MSGFLGLLGASWIDQLVPASWRGIPFVVKGSRVRRGRKTAVHEYPFADFVWVEDLGRGVRAYSFRGFVVGDDCYFQRDALVAAAETPGPGELVHPSIGPVFASLISFSAAEDAENGRMVALDFEFVETVQPTYPGTSISTGDQVDTAADGLDAASSADLSSDIGAATGDGSAVAPAAAQTVGAWSGVGVSAVGDPGLPASAVRGLPGNYGRYSGGALMTPLPATATLPGVLAATTTARTAVSAAGAAAIASASGL